MEVSSTDIIDINEITSQFTEDTDSIITTKTYLRSDVFSDYNLVGTTQNIKMEAIKRFTVRKCTERKNLKGITYFKINKRQGRCQRSRRKQTWKNVQNASDRIGKR